MWSGCSASMLVTHHHIGVEVRKGQNGLVRPAQRPPSPISWAVGVGLDLDHTCAKENEGPSQCIQASSRSNGGRRMVVCQ